MFLTCTLTSSKLTFDDQVTRLLYASRTVRLAALACLAQLSQVTNSLLMLALIFYRAQVVSSIQEFKFLARVLDLPL